MATPESRDEVLHEPSTIGATLRAAREAAGYSIEEVSVPLHLVPRDIENLEMERFDQFPVPVFLRGYLRSYARLLGLDATSVLEEYDRRGFEPPRLDTSKTVRTTPRSSERILRIATLIVIVLLIVLSILWWQDQWEAGDAALPNGATSEDAGTSGGTSAGTGGPTEREPVTAPANDASAPTRAGETPLPATAGGTAAAPPVTPAAGQTTANASASASPAPSATPIPDATASEARAPASDSSEPVSAPSAADADDDASAAANTPTTGTMEASATSPAMATTENEEDGTTSPTTSDDGDDTPVPIVIWADVDTWLILRDASGNLGFHDLVAGRVLRLSAIPPVQVDAGRAEGLRIEYDGEPFDVSPHVATDTAITRFMLGRRP